jgi:hypothetical protein
MPVEDKEEAAMIRAHQRGINQYLLVPRHDDQSLLQLALWFYRTENERDAFIAGYMGARRRAQEKP